MHLVLYGHQNLWAYLMASESMCTGAILSSKNLTISRKGFVGCLGYVNLRVISLCNMIKTKK